MASDSNITICPYYSFGNKKTLYIKGRVLQNLNLRSSDKDEVWDNLLNMYKRLTNTVIKGAKLKATYRSNQIEFYTDDDGYFGTSLEITDELNNIGGWYDIELELISSSVPFKKPVTATAKVLVPALNARFGIISDIDDTILQTNTTSIIKMAYQTFTKNARTRVPFHGVSAFYRALQKGPTGIENNPVFYVSSSPWNLYDLLIDFMAMHSIPTGPIFLKDYGFTRHKIVAEGHIVHKTKKIRKIMDAFPDLKFILIGDSGQEDPEIYSEVAKLYPGRIQAIYIRDVTLDERDREVETVLHGSRIEMVYAENSYSAAQHAQLNGFLNSEMLPEILHSVEKDSVKEE